MNWAEEVAVNLIKKHPDLEVFTIASGVSPSGYVHIGNFREIVTTYFVGEELKKLGKKVRYILSIDNFDRFRKVPVGINPDLADCIGKSYVDIPSPFGTDKSYAKEMQDILETELSDMGIEPEYIYQADEYRSGRYLDQIKLAMIKKGEIFDILARYKTQEFTDEDRENYYPISIYCDTCGKDFTKITSYDETSGALSYVCDCGAKHDTNINDSRNIKLVWKVDWPMRWAEENVVFEPGGMDHSAANGSYVIGKEIVDEIFNFSAPDYVAYNFIGIKGGAGKMSSSTGRVLTLSDLLKIYDKYLILWFYAKYRPNSEFDIALDNDVLRYYSEFDRMVAAYYADKLDDKNASIMRLIGVPKDYLNQPNFSYLATFLPIVNYDVELLEELLLKEDKSCANIAGSDRLEKAKFWIENYGEDYQVKLLENKNQEYYNTLSDEEKNWIARTIDVVSRDYETTTDLQNELYAVVKTADIDEKELKAVQKRYFQILYNLLLGKDQGPKLGLYLSAVATEEIIKRISF